MSNINSNIDKEEAFKKLFDQYYAPFCIYAKHFINNTEVCEDIVSDIFAIIWEKFEASTFNTPFMVAYIKTCIKNTCLNYIKHLDIIENNTQAYQQFNRMGNEVNTLDELYRQVMRIIKELPAHYHTILWSSFFENKTQQEIAKELNISTKSVGRYKAQVLQLLRERLKEMILICIFL